MKKILNYMLMVILGLLGLGSVLCFITECVTAGVSVMTIILYSVLLSAMTTCIEFVLFNGLDWN